MGTARKDGGGKGNVCGHHQVAVGHLRDDVTMRADGACYVNRRWRA